MIECPDIPDFLRQPFVLAEPKETDDMAKANQEPGPGHNRGPASIARDQLRAIVERVEKLEEEKAAIAGDIKEVYAEAKANGYDTKILREVVRLRKMDAAKRQEREALLETYMHALGMLADTPLGQSALSAFGQPVEPTDEEKAKGVIAAFVDKDGVRSSLAVPNQA